MKLKHYYIEKNSVQFTNHFMFISSISAETGPIDQVELTNTFESVVDDDELLLRMDGVADTVISGNIDSS